MFTRRLHHEVNVGQEFEWYVRAFLNIQSSSNTATAWRGWAAEIYKLVEGESLWIVLLSSG